MYFYEYHCLCVYVCASGVCCKKRAIELKASGSEKKRLKAGGHIKQTALKQLYRLCFIEEKDFKHTPKIQEEQDINTTILYEYYWCQLWWYKVLDESFINVLAFIVCIWLGYR